MWVLGRTCPGLPTNPDLVGGCRAVIVGTKRLVGVLALVVFFSCRCAFVPCVAQRGQIASQFTASCWLENTSVITPRFWPTRTPNPSIVGGLPTNANLGSIPPCRRYVASSAPRLYLSDVESFPLSPRQFTKILFTSFSLAVSNTCLRSRKVASKAMLPLAVTNSNPPCTSISICSLRFGLLACRMISNQASVNFTKQCGVNQG